MRFAVYEHGLVSRYWGSLSNRTVRVNEYFLKGQTIYGRYEGGLIRVLSRNNQPHRDAFNILIQRLGFHWTPPDPEGNPLAILKDTDVISTFESSDNFFHVENVIVIALTTIAFLLFPFTSSNEVFNVTGAIILILVLPAWLMNKVHGVYYPHRYLLTDTHLIQLINYRSIPYDISDHFSIPLASYDRVELIQGKRPAIALFRNECTYCQLKLYSPVVIQPEQELKILLSKIRECIKHAKVNSE